MLLQADALAPFPLADGSVHCCVSSPPYWGLRDYGVAGQLGLEATPAEYVANMVSVFREVWRVLRDDGTLWLNLGDSYATDQKGSGGATSKQATNKGSFHRVWKNTERQQFGVKHKDLCGIPWMVAFALRADGWYLRSDIIWSKPNPMPESVTDRPTKAHEYLFLLAKRERYFYDAEAVKEPIADSTAGDNRLYDANYQAGRPERGYPGGNSNHGSGLLKPATHGHRNRRTVWEIPTAPYSGAHFATFPPALVEPCILAGTSAAGVCAECGAPWERVTESQRISDDRPSTNLKLQSDGVFARGGNQATYGRVGVYQSTTTGWRPTCGCEAATVPATVLDPFCGSGTTGAVARLHGRRFVGLDLSREYLATLALPRAEGRSTAASLATLPLFAAQALP